MAKEIKMLIVAITIFLGTMFTAFVVIGRTSSVVASSRPATASVDAGDAPSPSSDPSSVSIPKDEVGDYTGTHQVMDEADPWTGEAHLTVNPDGTITGSTALPSSDGNSITQEITGTVTEQGTVTLDCDAASFVVDGPVIDHHMFSLKGTLTAENDGFRILASGAGNQDSTEKIVAILKVHPLKVAHRLAQTPSDLLSLKQQANRYSENGQYAEATPLYEEALHFQPRSPSLHYDLAECYRHGKQTDLALGEYRRSIALDGHQADAHWGLGVALISAHKYHAAVAELQEDLALKPDDADGVESLGMAYYSLGEYGKAIASYRRAVAMRPQDTGTRFFLGATLMQMGRHKKGMQEWQRVLNMGASKNADKIREIIAGG